MNISAGNARMFGFSTEIAAFVHLDEQYFPCTTILLPATGLPMFEKNSNIDRIYTNYY
jgi:hypothetical protein